MALDTFLLYLAAWTLVALSPGPAVMFVMSQAARHGMRGAVAGTGGIVFGHIVCFSAVAFGLAALLAKFNGAITAIRVIGAKIVSATGFFDTPVDGITRQTENEITFISQTTGDTDSIDLTLDQAREGTIVFDSKVGQCEVQFTDLSDAVPRSTFPLGGLDMSITIERYPENPTQVQLSMQREIIPPVESLTPYFVKATQVDGQMAWASPIYLRRGRG